MMSMKSTLLAAVAAVSFALPAVAGEVMVHDPYARVSAMMSNSGAAFMVIENMTGQDDHLVSAESDVAEKTELHTHLEDANGVMKMVHVAEGFDLPKDGKIMMVRGGNHVMFLGLNRQLSDGDMVHVTLHFEKAGAVEVDVPVDLNRKPDHAMMKHGNMQMGNGQKKMSN